MKKSSLVLGCLLLAAAGFTQPGPHPSWARRANIYEVNIRQYTREGTFKAFLPNLGRLKAMGVDIVWVMPVNPISKIDRKGTLGSYYAVSDYTAVNPEFGTLADFRALVKAVHSKGMKLILDWVPNHTGADNRWLTQHPDFFKKDSSGKAAVPFDWTDTRQLDYGNPVLRDSMIAAMEYWIRTADIDGFRCDVAWNVPGDFWRTCIGRLRKMKPLFMLAEGDKTYLAQNGFDALYPWDMFHTMIRVAKGDANALAIDSVLQQERTAYPPGTLEMYFTSNHDENSWNGADYNTFPGPSHAPFAVLTQTLPDNIPLIYSGQEEPVLRAISFFEKDSIRFRHYARAKFYATLLALRKRSPALDADAAFTKLSVGDDRAVYAFLREKSGHKVLVLLNFSNAAQPVKFGGALYGYPTDIFSDKTVAINGDQWTLDPWQYKVLEYPPADTVAVGPDFLKFKSRHGQTITVHAGNIYLNGTHAFPLKDPDVIYASKRNQLIEDGGALFLALEIDGRPNEDRLNVYRITDKAVLAANAISSDIADMDGDGNLEFGGSDLTEGYPSRDSMYYIPAKYYEIREGRIFYDSVYSIAMERKLNGVYLSQPLNQNGNCCKVVPIPGKKNTTILVDTGLVSERIDGPANIRDTIAGKPIFRLNDNVAVSTTDTSRKWYRIGLLVDLTPAEIHSQRIPKGDALLVNGLPVGTALDTLPIPVLSRWNEATKGVLLGYTAANNIKPNTVPEKLLSRMVRLNGPMDVGDLDYFSAAFHLSIILDRPYGGLDLLGDEILYNGNRPPRILLIFNQRNLYAIIHARKMDYHGSKEYSLNAGCTLTVVGRQPQPLIDKLIKDFDSFNQ